MSTNPTTFNQLALDNRLLDNLVALEYTEMTAIQALTLPSILAGKDVIAKAKTGSGKTAAFGLGILSALEIDKYKTQALVICPTRELAEQVASELRRLARLMSNIKILTLCGGSPIIHQVNSLEHSAHIVVGTPGRLCDHLKRQTLDLSALRCLVLDEADRMLDMGFEDDIKRIIEQTPKQKQTLLFSATYPDGIEKMSRSIQHEAEYLAIDEVNMQIDQRFYEVSKNERLPILAKLLTIHPAELTIIFCNTKVACQQVENYLKQQGFSAVALHGDLEQREREQVLLQFANKSRPILVATDVAARGLDIKELDLVINYELAYDPQVHVHRVGRTGRAGEAGLAITLVAANEMPRANSLEQAQNMRINWLMMDDVTFDPTKIVQPTMQTLSLTIGRKNKIRPGDILGALTKDAGIDGQLIGKIVITELYSYVAIDKTMRNKALSYFKQGKIKGKSVRAHLL